jgi:uncharacterized repeat protein (TIGR01451 family)
VVATGPSSTDIAGYDPASNTPLTSVGGGHGWVGVTPPAGAAIEGIFIQGTNAVLFGRVSTGAFVQSFSLADGSSSGPTILTQPGGTSFTATGGGTSPGAAGATNFFISGSDTIGHTPMLVTGTVTNGNVSTSPLCPSYFSPLAPSGPFAPSAVAVNLSDQILLAGVQINGLTQLPAVGAVNTGCTALSISPLAQPGGATNDGFADAINTVLDGSFIVGSDLSLATGAALLFNRVQANGTAVAGSSPLQGHTVSSAGLTNVFGLGTGFAGIGTETNTGSPSQGVLYRYDAGGNLIGGNPTAFGDSNHADLFLNFAVPLSSGAAIGGLGSPVSGPPNTLDIFEATTNQVPPPPCAPVVLSVKKTISVFLKWSAKGGAVHSFPLNRGTSAHTAPGDTVQYIVTVSNDGNCDAGGVEITDPLPRGFTYQPGASHVRVETSAGSTVQDEAAPRSLTGGTFRLSVPVLKPHQQAVLVIGGKTTAAGKLENTAGVTADGGVSEVSEPTTLTSLTPPPPPEHFKLDLNDSRAIYPISNRPHAEPVGHLDVAVEKDGPHGTCQWLNGKGQVRVVAGGCAPPWLPAKTGTKSWSFKFRKPLSPGNYLMFVRPVGSDGAEESNFSVKMHNLFPFTVRH